MKDALLYGIAQPWDFPILVQIHIALVVHQEQKTALYLCKHHFYHTHYQMLYTALILDYCIQTTDLNYAYPLASTIVEFLHHHIVATKLVLMARQVQDFLASQICKNPMYL
jgi:hypothetical protein